MLITRREDSIGQGFHLQTRFSWPVPILRVAKRTTVLKMVRVPRMKVKMRPVEEWRICWHRKMTGTA